MVGMLIDVLSIFGVLSLVVCISLATVVALMSFIAQWLFKYVATRCVWLVKKR